MSDIKAIIVDDEESARDILENILLNFNQDVSVLEKCDGVPSAVKAIEKHNPDVVFLDIEMSKFNGFELLDFIDEVTFDIVFVTAYNQYAVRAFEVSALDYLLKPIRIENVENALEKVRKNVSVSNSLSKISALKENIESQTIKKLGVHDSEGTKFVDPMDILLLEADGAYTTIYMLDGSKYTESKKIKFFENVLEEINFFYRIHRSYIVNLSFIQSYSRSNATLILKNGFEVKVARDRKHDFDEKIHAFRL